MERGWILAAAAAAALGAAVTAEACAASNEQTAHGAGGEGGAGGESSGGAGVTGGGGNGGGQIGGGGAGGMAPDLCGNGVVDPPEQCDGADLGGQTCEALGLGPGTLICNAACGIVVSDCTPKELCQNFVDDDGDLLVDCDDTECSAETTCADSCTPPKVANLPYVKTASTKGRPSSQVPSCSATSGRDVVFEVVAPVDGDLTVAVSTTSGVDFSLSVRTACGDPASEIACTNAQPKGSAAPETLAIPVTANATYLVVVDGDATPSGGDFSIGIHVGPPESACDNHLDDDFDALTDCEDPSCQALPSCAPGSGAVGTPCTQASDCAASNGAPLCIDESTYGWANGYCTQYCKMGGSDCPAGSSCGHYVDWASGAGSCFKTCFTLTDCPPGYTCGDLGAGNVCYF